jgi:hypothetical protein
VGRSITRTAALALSIVLALGTAVVPCAAADPASTRTGTSTSSLTRLSPASQQLLTRAVPAAQQQPPAEAPSSPSSFFHSKRGAITLAAMGGGMAFAIWSINHDRQPVKSPIR